MISFRDFYFLKENPDTVKNVLPDGREIELGWDDPQSYSFGFFNPNPSIDIGDLRGKMVMEEEGRQGGRKTHAHTLMDFLKSNNRMDIVDLLKDEDVRQVLQPAGRIWVGIPIQGGVVNAISFWCPNYDVTWNEIKQILNWFLIGEEDYEKTFVEFLGNKKTLIPLSKYQDSKKPKKISKEEQAEIQRQQSEKHVIGGKKNPNFGAKEQARDAERAGERSYAEYKQKLDPHGFHGESYSPQRNS